MAGFAKLLKSTGRTLQKMQEEQAALVAAGRYPDVKGPINVYHGTNREWADNKPDFENNLRSGEGALAYGPGGYTSGNRPLAAHYAYSLARPRPARTIPAVVHSGPLGRSHLALQQALKQAPEEVLNWLQASQYDGARKGAQTDTLLYANEGPKLDKLRTQLSVGMRRTPTWEQVLQQANGRPRDVISSITERRIANKEPYEEWLARAEDRGLDLSRQNVNSGNIKDIVELARDLSKDGPPPADPFSVTRKLPYEEWSDMAMDDLLGQRAFGGHESIASVSNLRHLAAARQGLEPTGKVKRGMGSSFGLRFHKDWRNLLEGWDGKPEVLSPARHVPAVSGADRRIYEMELHADPDEMFSYDWELSQEHPDVLGALGRVAQELGVSFSPTETGMHLINRLQNDSRLQPRRVMETFRDAGIPAMYYLRAGPRDKLSNAAPSTFNPEDLNFLIFDQNRLQVKDVKNKAQGGLV